MNYWTSIQEQWSVVSVVCVRRAENNSLCHLLQMLYYDKNGDGRLHLSELAKCVLVTDFHRRNSIVY